MDVRIDQVIREQRFINDHPEYKIHRLGRCRFVATRGSAGNTVEGSAIGLEDLLNKLDLRVEREAEEAEAADQ
jgi:hypothetical protein